ncbi:hypothetical protein J5N97_015548 [Dioscorea zingiberensis]|uniref:glucose-1-phosphate adenylyltransferase n=1 Tax=Dioscorea zingiberensis TaxID=325984 RepID=A0A9D5HKP6_9LILI|nr:hypothetical protein J5N97_015548 [Dioscorea zingiberensis]
MVVGLSHSISLCDRLTTAELTTSPILIEQPLQEPVVQKPPADPKTVASIILGGGAGTRLFPLTSRRAKPAFNPQSLNRHLARTYDFANGVNFGRGFVEVLAATQTPGESGKRWFQGTADVDAKLRHTENILILSGDHLYRMDYMDFVQKHIDSGADISVSCIPMDDSRASDFGLVKIDENGHILEKPKGESTRTMAYLFNGYWEDIGTIKSFFDANLALTNQPPKFHFYDPSKPIFTSPRYLPPTKAEKCRVLNSIISHGCFLAGCTVEHSVVGVRSRLEHGVEFKDTMMMGADYYQTETERGLCLKHGKVPIGVGANTKIRNCIIDKNARIGKNVVIANGDNVKEADRPEEGFYIRSGVTVVLKNSTIAEGTVI